MGNNIGFLSAVCHATDVPGIIACNLNTADHFASPSHPIRLLHNPHAESKCVTGDVGPVPRDVYDTVAGTFVRSRLAGSQISTLALDQAAVLVVVPSGEMPRHIGRRSLVGDVVIDYRVQQAE